MPFGLQAGAWPQVPGSVRSAGSALKQGFAGYAKTGLHRRGMMEMTHAYGLARGMSKMGRAFGIGFGLLEAGFGAYSGYQTGGVGGAVWGAAKGVAEGAAFTYGVGALLGGAAVPLGLTVGAVGLAAGGAFAYDQFSKETGRATALNAAKLEMGSGYVPDQFGQGATMRRRSMAALQNSRINGVMAMGNEAALSYTPYFR